MILTHDDLSAIEASFGPEKAAPIINAFEKLEREQKVEVKRDLLVELATKSDIERLKVDIAVLRGEITELRGELRGEITELRGDLRGEITELRSELCGKIADLRGEVKRVESDLKGEIKRLEMLIKVPIGLVVGAMGLFSPVGVELIKLIK